MKLIASLTDKDVGEKAVRVDKFVDRKAVRAVIFDKEGKVAIMKVEKEGAYKIPGGGVDEGESLIDALKREVEEESGASIKNIKELGRIVEERTVYPLRQESFCYTADVVSVGKTSFTKNEKNAGFSVLWMSTNDAIKAFESVVPNKYKAKFVSKREFIILKEAIRMRKKNFL
jgi:8-oxo-dGTP diphosphatase